MSAEGASSVDRQAERNSQAKGPCSDDLWKVFLFQR